MDTQDDRAQHLRLDKSGDKSGSDSTEVWWINGLETRRETETPWRLQYRWSPGPAGVGEPLPLIPNTGKKGKPKNTASEYEKIQSHSTWHWGRISGGDRKWLFAGIMAKTLPDFIKKKKNYNPTEPKFSTDSKHKRNAQTHAKTLQGHMTKKRDTTKTTQNWQTDTNQRGATAAFLLWSLKVGRYQKKMLQKQFKEREAAKDAEGQRGENKY